MGFQDYYSNSVEDQNAVRAAFLKNPEGKVAVAFDDPTYARSDFLIVDYKDMSAHIVLHGQALFVGHLSTEMLAAFMGNDEVLFTAEHYDGGVFDLTAPIQLSGY